MVGLFAIIRRNPGGVDNLTTEQIESEDYFRFADSFWIVSGWRPSGSCRKLTRIEMLGSDRQNPTHGSKVIWLDSPDLKF